MNLDDVWKTTFKTKFGHFEWKVIPFALTNTPTTFMRFINHIFIAHLGQLLVIYLDDILIYSENLIEHEEHVQKVLRRLRKAGLQTDIKKCEFSVTCTKYLSFIVSTDSIKVDLDKVSVIHE